MADAAHSLNMSGMLWQNIPTKFADPITDILKYLYGGTSCFGMKIFVRRSPAIPSPMGLCKSPGSHDLWYILTEWADGAHNL